MLPQSNKLRAIDDGRFSGHNQASFLEETIYVSSPDSVSAACKYCIQLLRDDEGHLPSWSQPLFGTSDMSSAYRQIPNHPEEAAAMIVAYCDREVNELRYAVLKAHPYGLAASVLNFNRTPCFLTALARRVAAACASNYFDDTGVLDFAAARGSAQSFLWQLYTLLGFTLDPDKDGPMASQRHFLGLLLDLARALSDTSMMIHLKEGLAESLLSDIGSILSSNRCTPAEAAKLRGKLGWASCAMYGRCGRGGQAYLCKGNTMTTTTNSAQT